MKKLYTLVVLLFACQTLCAQHMSVESFTALESDMDARVQSPKYDQNGRKAAIIKVETIYKGFSFDVGSMGIVDVDHEKTAETWVYVPSGVIRMTIQHPELGTIRDYQIPIPIHEACVYRLVLTTDRVETVVHQRANGQYLALSVEPYDIDMTISVDNGAPIPIVGGEYSQWLTYGDHTYRISANMYQTFAKSISVGNERVVEQVKLTPNYATLSINATPKAKVTINKLSSGSTPLKQTLELGTYAVKLTAPGFQDYNETVNISEPLSTVVIDKELEPYFSQISISVPMREAAISINDEPRGTGTWSGTLMPATYIVKAEREGHRPTLYTLEVQANTPQSITLESPTPIYGSLNVNSNTVNANLYLDGELLGQTPNFFDKVLAGSHTLSLRKEGFSTQTQTVTVEEGHIAEVSFNLQRNQATPRPGSSTRPKPATPKSQIVSNTPAAPKQPKPKSKKDTDIILLGQISPNSHYNTYSGMVGAAFSGSGFYLGFGYCDNLPKGPCHITECDNSGVIFDTEHSSPLPQKFTSNVYVERLSITVGYVQRLAKPLYLYAGGGYGKRKVMWEPIDNPYSEQGGYFAKNIDLSSDSYTLEAGGIIKLGPVALTVGYRTLGLKANELTLGAGFIF